MSMRQKHSRMKIDVSSLADRKVDDDFKKMLFAEIGEDLKKFRVFGEIVMVASYIAPRKTAGGIILPDNSLDEDRWQGKVGLIVKMGPMAFKYRGQFKWEWDEAGPPKIGDYVCFNSADGFDEVGIRGHSLRWIPDQLLKQDLHDPKIIY